MSKWLIEATIPIKVVVEANGEYAAALRALEKISNTYGIRYDRIGIESKTEVR
jgi:hypothetical protein